MLLETYVQARLRSCNTVHSESWIGDLKKAVADLSGSPTAQKSSAEVGASLDTLGKAFADSESWTKQRSLLQQQ